MKQLSAFIKSARFAEVSILLGFPMIGLFFAFKSADQLVSIPVFLFAAAIFSLFTAIYAFNGLSGTEDDKHNSRLADLAGKRRSFIVTLAVSLVLSLILFFMIKPVLAAFSAVSFLLWCVYSFPKKGFKYRPVLGTMIHFFGQIIHFLMGYTAIAPLDKGSAAASVYFALLFSAGHINHELIDHDADEKAGTRTGAVRFGVKTWEKLSFALFTLAALYISVLSAIEKELLPMWLPFIIAGIIHITFKICKFKKVSVQAKFLEERLFYRILYFVAGIVFIAAKIFDFSKFIK
ncbi:UbiA family prenyltransferase [bacterium]|nr:UbiA family prenyltransferase [bacterium]